MNAIARVNDMTSHGTPLMPGSVSIHVFVENQKVWLCNIDQHICPLFSGNNPHVGGYVTVGSNKVFINGYSIAMRGDKILENGTTNTIVSGSNKVFIK